MAAAPDSGEPAKGKVTGRWGARGARAGGRAADPEPGPVPGFSGVAGSRQFPSPPRHALAPSPGLGAGGDEAPGGRAGRWKGLVPGERGFRAAGGQALAGYLTRRDPEVPSSSENLG